MDPLCLLSEVDSETSQHFLGQCAATVTARTLVTDFSVVF